MLENLQNQQENNVHWPFRLVETAKPNVCNLILVEISNRNKKIGGFYRNLFKKFGEHLIQRVDSNTGKILYLEGTKEEIIRVYDSLRNKTEEHFSLDIEKWYIK
jgi:hypothetical protein